VLGTESREYISYLRRLDSNGVYEGVAIGGDRYPGSRFMDHLLRYNDNPAVHMLVLLGEVGGTDEYHVCEALKSGRISKPLVAWCIGTCASIFPYEVQFGHAGALAGGVSETAVAKNKALEEAGARVPKTFIEFGTTIQAVYESLVKVGSLVPSPEPEPPKIPMDWSWAKRLGLVRKPANFISSISDDRGEELTYSGMAISEVFQKDLGVGGVVSLLWFRRQLPDYAAKFIEVSPTVQRPTSAVVRAIRHSWREFSYPVFSFCR
jgi:ATP citrate (pro-S)-lyase